MRKLSQYVILLCQLTYFLRNKEGAWDKHILQFDINSESVNTLKRKHFFREIVVRISLKRTQFDEKIASKWSRRFSFVIIIVYTQQIPFSRLKLQSRETY